MSKFLYLSVAFLFTLSCSLTDGRSKGNEESGTALKDVQVGIGIGDQAPEIVLESPDGEKIALSSLRGKMVLIDFWAAWCGPCRRENPNLVYAYNQFNNREFSNGSGFTVYSVSLDRKKEDWVSAIENDKLAWEYHVSDLKGWKSEAAAMYEVTGIPMNFLIDGDGIIVATGLRGQFLENKLLKLWKKP